MDFPPYVPLPPTLPLGHSIKGLRIKYPYFHNNDSIYYLAEKHLTLQEFFPHPKTLGNTLPFEVERTKDGNLISSSEKVFAERLDMFLNGAKLWTQLSQHSVFLRVLDCFQQNGTAYAIRDYFAGQPLSHYTPTSKEWKTIVETIMQGLKIIHNLGYSPKGFSSPEIWVTRTKRIKLLDFSYMKKIDEEFNPDRDFRRVVKLLRTHARFIPKEGLTSEQIINNFLSK